MPRIPFPAILAIGLFAVAATQAEERRGIRVPIGVPGLSGGETIQKVLDQLTVAALKRSDSKYVDLGYLHKGGGEGEWIGYIGSSQTYLPLDEFELKMLLKIAGMPTPPPVPERPGGGYRSWWIIAAVLLVVGGWKSLCGLSLRAMQASQRFTLSVVQSNDEVADWSKAHDEIARAAERQVVPSRVGAGQCARGSKVLGARQVSATGAALGDACFVKRGR